MIALCLSSPKKNPTNDRLLSGSSDAALDDVTWRVSPRAIEILEVTKLLGSTSLFAGNRGKLSIMAMTMLLRRMKVDVTVHGFRSTFRDWSAECTGYAHEVCEMTLAHTIGNKAEAAYRRGDLFEKRRRLMADWATFCDTPAAIADNVEPIRRSGV